MTVHWGDGTSQTSAASAVAGDSVCRAWVNFNGQGTVAIRDDKNITSITDNGTGYYNVNFTTNQNDSNYATTIGADGRSVNSRHCSIDYLSYSTSTVRVTIEDTSQYGASRADCILISVAIFGGN